jgi:hypothetical protein
LGIASGINFSLERQNYAIDTSSEDDLGIWYRQTSQSFDIPLGLRLYPLATQCVSLNTGLQFHAILKAKQNIKDIDAMERVTKRNKTQYGRQAGNRINFYCAVGARILRQPMPISLELQYLFGLTDYKQDSFLHDYTVHAITFFVSWQLKKQQ